MRFLREDQTAVDGSQDPRAESSELERQRFEDGLFQKLREHPQKLESSVSSVAPKAKGSGFYSGQLMAAAGLWVGTALIPWLGGSPMVELAGYPVGVAVTIFLPFSVYFATVVNPSVPMVQKPYGIEYTSRSGRRLVIGLNGAGRSMTKEELRELDAHNAEVNRQEQNRLELERFEHRRLKRERLAERRRTPLSSKLQDSLRYHRRR